MLSDQMELNNESITKWYLQNSKYLAFEVKEGTTKDIRKYLTLNDSGDTTYQNDYEMLLRRKFIVLLLILEKEKGKKLMKKYISCKH